MTHPLVVIESPLAGDLELNIAYAQACCYDSILHSEAPFASHLFYTQLLDDLDPSERKLGMHLGWEVTLRANFVAVYVNFGISSGMQAGNHFAKAHHVPVIYRSLGDPKWPTVPPELVTSLPAIGQLEVIESKIERSTFTLQPPPFARQLR